MSVRVVLAEDHTILRDGLCALLAATGRVEVVGVARDGQEAVAEVARHLPDVLLSDICMPKLNGIDAIRRVHAAHPKVAAIVLSVHGEREYVIEALRAGASGYLLKDSSLADVLHAIDTVVGGHRFLGGGLADIALDGFLERSNREPSEVDRLTPREREILGLIAEGRTTDAIGAHLHLSPHTVQTHRRNLMEKLGLRRTIDLTKFALRHGLATLD